MTSTGCFQSLCLQCQSHHYLFLLHVIFVSKKKDAPVYVFKSFVCAAAFAGLCRGSGQQRAPQTDEHLDSKRLWDDRYSLSWAQPSICSVTYRAATVTELGEAAASSPGVSRGWGTQPGEFTGRVRSPCCRLAHGLQFSLDFVCCSALSLN